MDTVTLTLTEARTALERGEYTAEELRAAYLEQIERLNPKINAYITVLDEPQGDVIAMGSLAGLPLAIKDLYETAGVRTTAGTRFFAEYIPTQDAEAVRRLKLAGANILGKTNTHEIALGVTNINRYFGNCLNPWDTKRVTGGSSGGSAAAVVSGMAPAALGTDTGGSIRIPASLCGVVGLKPTYGRTSLRGIFPLSWNLDHAGPLTKTARDAAMLLQVLAGYDQEDPASIDTPVDDYLTDLEAGIWGWRIALAVGEYIEGADPQVLRAVREAAEHLRGMDVKVTEVEVPWLRESAVANGLMTTADGAAFHRARLKEQPDWFGADVRMRLETGAGYTSTEYALARRTQSEARRQAEQLFEEFDLLLLPTTPSAAPLIEGSDAIEQARQLTRFTAPFNLTGMPAISMPCGFTQEGLPIGLQMVAGAWQEARLLRAARAWEGERGTEERRPALEDR
jgi:aspartyl-tRNA(Asn)/glutamyl-tRNA(Gln) amidotransferase subunit A